MILASSATATPPEVLDRLRAGQADQAVALLRAMEARTPAQELALGDLLWRQGDLGAAREAWRRVTSGAAEEEALLREARIAGPEHADELLPRLQRLREHEPDSPRLTRATVRVLALVGRLEEALEMVQGDEDEPALRRRLAALALRREPPAPGLALDLLGGSAADTRARPLLLGICRAALRGGHLAVAGRAAALLGGGELPEDAFWRALTRIREEERVRALEELAARPDVPAAARRAGAARLALAGRLQSARRLVGDTDAVLGVLLDYALFGRIPQVASCDWDALRRACASSPGLFEALCPGPRLDGDPPEDPVEYWAARGEIGRAREVLRAKLARDPWQVEALRRMLLLAWLDHARQDGRAPDPGAWEDLVACGAVLVANPRLLGGWVGQRLRVYSARDDLNARTTDLVEDLRQRLWEAAARGGTETGAGQRRIELVIELQGAEALRAGGALTREGEALGCGPIFARRFGLVSELRARFGLEDLDERERRERERNRLLRELGLGGAGADKDGRGAGFAELRVWFSELGRAAAREHLGDHEGALADLEASYRRWILPDEEGWVAAAEANLGFAELPDARNQLLQAAAERICEVAVARLERDMRGGDFNYERCRASFQGVFAIAESLGVDYEARYQVTRLVVGRYRALLECGDALSLEQASALLEGAAAAGIRDLERPRAVVANHAATIYREHGRLDLAVQSLEKALAQQPEERALLGNLVSVMTEYAMQLAQQGVDGRARAMARRARELVAEAHKRLPGADLSEVDQIVMAGLKGVDATPPLPAEARPILRRYAALRQAGDLEPALQAAREARALMPDHVELQIVEARAGLEVVRSAPRERGSAVHEDIGRLLRTAVGEHSLDPRLHALLVEHRRAKLMLEEESPLTLLLRRALEAMRGGQVQPAIRVLEIGMILNQSRDPGLCDLLAHCLVEVAEGQGGARDPRGRRSLARAQALVEVGLRQDPLHPGLDATQRRIERLGFGRRNDDA